MTKRAEVERKNRKVLKRASVTRMLLSTHPE